MGYKNHCCGGYHLGDAASYRGLGSHVAALTHCSVFLMNYPLAPEHRFPAAYDAAIHARDWLAVSGIERLALVGDSAGGGLALADELLLDDSQSYAQLAAQKGTEVHLDVFEGMHHVFQRDVGVIETASVALGLAANFINKHW
jgi:acetyl esterase/lipase